MKGSATDFKVGNRTGGSSPTAKPTRLEDLTDCEGRVWNYMGVVGSETATFVESNQVELKTLSAVDQAMRLRPRLLLNGKVYRLSEADVLDIALSETSCVSGS